MLKVAKVRCCPSTSLNLGMSRVIYLIVSTCTNIHNAISNSVCTLCSVCTILFKKISVQLSITSYKNDIHLESAKETATISLLNYSQSVENADHLSY